MGNAGLHSYPDDGEGPVRRLRLHPFWIDARAVSNADSARFMEGTGYDTGRTLRLVLRIRRASP